MKKQTLSLAFSAAVILFAASSTKLGAVDRWGGGVGFNQYGRSTFGTLSIVGGYATSSAALSAAVNGRTDRVVDQPNLLGHASF